MNVASCAEWKGAIIVTITLHESDPRVALRFALAYVFGQEWIDLSRTDQALIVRDCTEDGGVQDIQQYRRNIGRGNLQAYAECLRVRFSR